MKRYFILALLIFFLSIAGNTQKNKPDEYSGYVRYERANVPGTITVTSTGFAKKKLDSSKDAVREAFFTLLFRGIPGSQYDLPMIPDEQKKDDPAVKALLAGGSASFVTENSFRGDEKKTRREDGLKGTMTTHEITINCDALRRHLEATGVIRKFGI